MVPKAWQTNIDPAVYVNDISNEMSDRTAPTPKLTFTETPDFDFARSLDR